MEFDHGDEAATAKGLDPEMKADSKATPPQSPNSVYQ
jgi:hypothetical protein